MTRDDERAELLLTICKNRADDSTRLMFADWLDRYGTMPLDHEWAEFIRLQLAPRRPQPHAVRAAEANREAELGALLARKPRMWMANQSIIEIRGSWKRALRRGFLTRVRFTIDDWLANGARCVAMHPIEFVTVSDRYPFEPTMPPLSHAYWYVQDHPASHYSNMTAGYTVPFQLEPYLSGHKGREYLLLGESASYRYASLRVAAIDLSAACIAYARAMAGLNPVTAPVRKTRSRRRGAARART